MKLKEVVSMLNEYAKVVGEDCETDISEIRVVGRCESDEYAGMYHSSWRDQKRTPRYHIRTKPDEPQVVYVPQPADSPVHP